MWDCRTLVAREQDPTRLLDSTDYGFTGYKRDIQQQRQEYDEICLRRGVNPNVFVLYREWMRIVLYYTRCNLTRHTDKLVAVSGLARKIHEALGPDEEYVGGIWKYYLHLHLLWDVRSGRTNFRWKEYTAPSWSWASIEGSVYNHRTNDEAASDCTSLIRGSTEQKPAKADPYGALSSAILYVEGPLLEVSLGPRKKVSHIVTTLTTKSGVQFSLPSDRVNVDLDFNFPGNDPMDVHCLIVIQEMDTDQNQLAGLILARQDSVKGQYIRIGLGFVLPTELLGEARSQRLADEGDYECMLENGDYRISII